MAEALGVAMGVPALGVRRREPLHKSRHLAVSLGPKNQVEMIGHQTIGAEAHRRFAFDGLGENSLECFVVAGILE